MYGILVYRLILNESSSPKTHTFLSCVSLPVWWFYSCLHLDLYSHNSELDMRWWCRVNVGSAPGLKAVSVPSISPFLHLPAGQSKAKLFPRPLNACKSIKGTWLPRTLASISVSCSIWFSGILCLHGLKFLMRTAQARSCAPLGPRVGQRVAFWCWTGMDRVECVG